MAGPAGTDAARFRRVLTRAIGLPQTAGEPDLYHYGLEDGDRLLLCTDGLTDMVDDGAIALDLGQAGGRRLRLPDTGRPVPDGGGRDNVTAVVAAYRLPPGLAARPAG